MKMNAYRAARSVPGQYPETPMTMTPWGEAERLHERRLRPGPGTSREEVERNQLERLYGATVAVTAEAGYGRTRVADVIALAGVSRATFYRFFQNKQECFLATLDALISAAIEATSTPIREAGTWEERAGAAIEVFTDLLVRQPASACFCLVESYAAGQAALDRVDEAMAGFERLIREILEQAPEQHAPMPPELTAAVVGGLRKIIHTRLHRQRQHELVELLPAVLNLSLTAYRPPPRPLVAETLPSPPPASPADADPVARICRATLAVVARHGYAGSSITEIAAEAGVSLSTFYAHFEGKEAVLDSAVDAGRKRLLAAAEPALREAPDWPRGIRASVEASLAFFQSEPDYTRVMTFEIFGAGAEAVELLDRALDAGGPFLDGGYEIAPDADQVAREVVPTFVYALIADRVRRRGVVDLPDLTPIATYIVLAPFLGPGEASRWACSS
jgi:TetR/AcrR family transcriptional regulator